MRFGRAGVPPLLAQTRELIADYRPLAAAGPEYLAEEHGEALALAAAVDELFTEPDDTARWERFAELYLTAYRLRRRVAMANPLLDFERLLLVRRGTTHPHLGLPQNWQSNCVKYWGQTEIRD